MKNRTASDTPVLCKAHKIFIETDIDLGEDIIVCSFESGGLSRNKGGLRFVNFEGPERQKDSLKRKVGTKKSEIYENEMGRNKA